MLERLKVTATMKLPLGEEAPLPGIPNLALRRERAANLVGAQILGYDNDWAAGLRAVTSAGLIIVLDADLDDADRAALAAAPGQLVILGTVFSDELRGAELILPVTTMAEEYGTYVNRDRRIQRYSQAKAQPGMARPAWWVAGEVIAGPGPSPSAPTTAAEAFAMVGQHWPAFSGITYGDIGYSGLVLDQASEAVAGSQRADLGFM
jgi:anaerobic selenocysteine-containing dehydrogenase